MSYVGLKVLSSGQKLDIEDYKMIFRILIEEYTRFCNEWLNSVHTKINLKKVCICDIYQGGYIFEETFKYYLDSFLEGSYELGLIIYERISVECNLFLRWRVKDYASLIYKAHQKNAETNGEFPINKCINDLLGFRIVDINYSQNIEKVKEHLEYLKRNKHRIRHINSSKNGYKGYHVYFNGLNNCCFPLELQIWDSKDERRNLELHKEYKQNYLEWLKTYNNFR